MKRVHPVQAGILAIAGGTGAGTFGIDPMIDPATGNIILLILNFLSALLPQLIKQRQ